MIEILIQESQLDSLILTVSPSDFLRAIETWFRIVANPSSC